ncbi:MAG: SCO family protein [Candidatus Magnetominusculus sp. LBB02]|nr:SCO family protein [Candidatus Magnetominusculus sp. LBB02]
MKQYLLFLCSAAAFVVFVCGTCAGDDKLTSPNEKETLGKAVPNVKLFDSYGKDRTMSDIIGGKPLIMSIIYTRCETACIIITDGLTEVVKKMGDAGKDYNVLTLSFDPSDTPERLAKFRTQWGLDGPGWVVASGEDADLKKLLSAIGFSYKLDKETGEFIHPNLLVILTPDGRISRYVYGVNYDDNNLKLSLLDAKRGTSTLSVMEGVLLWCYQYDPVTGSYRFDYAFLLEVISGLAFFISLLFFFFAKKVIACLRTFAGSVNVGQTLPADKN